MNDAPDSGIELPKLDSSATHHDAYLLRTLMEYLPDHIYFKDLESRFTAINRAKAERFGIKDPAEMIGKSDFDFFTSEHAQQAFEDEQTIIRTGEAIIGLEEKETWPDGRETWVSTTKIPLRDDEGRIIGTFGLSRDITERKEAHEKVARLAEELRCKNRTLEEDLEMARQLQSSMLPHHFPLFPRTATPENNAVQFCHFYKPSTSVSGDFYDVFEVSDTVAGIFICDVMGHGVRAAIVAAIVRAHLNELKPSWAKPGELLNELNRRLCKTLEREDTLIFASAVYVVVDLQKGELSYANAGHPSPLRVHDHSSLIKPHQLNGMKNGPALGLFADAEYQECRSVLTARDVILLFTDGLFEVESAKGQTYDYGDLLGAVDKRRNLPTEEMCRGVIEEVQEFSANREFTDDMCLVAVEVARLLPGGTGQARNTHGSYRSES